MTSRTYIVKREIYIRERQTTTKTVSIKILETVWLAQCTSVLRPDMMICVQHCNLCAVMGISIDNEHQLRRFPQQETVSCLIQGIVHQILTLNPKLWRNCTIRNPDTLGLDTSCEWIFVRFSL